MVEYTFCERYAYLLIYLPIVKVYLYYMLVYSAKISKHMEHIFYMMEWLEKPKIYAILVVYKVL